MDRVPLEVAPVHYCMQESGLSIADEAARLDAQLDEMCGGLAALSKELQLLPGETNRRKGGAWPI